MLTSTCPITLIQVQQEVLSHKLRLVLPEGYQELDDCQELN